MTQEIRDWVCLQGDYFLSTDVHRDLCLSTRVHKKTASQILSRLCGEGIIKRTGKRGEFRVIDRTEEVIDFMSVTDISGLPIAWPMQQMNGRFEILPGSVVLIAGEKDTGKTSFCLNMAWGNREVFDDVVYFSSSNEVNERVLRKRLEAFGYPLHEWQKVKFIRKGSNFQDVLRPDGLNIFDYLEIRENPWEIGSRIAEVSEKLRDGVALIACQKDPGKDLARGGASSLDKATLYVALNRGKNGKPNWITFPSVKYPAAPGADKPINYQVIENGSKFVEVTNQYNNTQTPPERHWTEVYDD
jgi:hypothetical protein